MGAFTEFSQQALERYLIMFGVGELHSYEPITAGIENSNYFVTTMAYEEKQEFVLTIIEDFSFDEVPFFHNVMTHLSHFGLPVPAPKTTLDGMTMTIFSGKPSLLVPKVPGSHLQEPDSSHCEVIGKAIAELHSVIASKNLERDNPYDAAWASDALEASTGQLPEAAHRQLAQLVAEYEELESLSLPRGIIHGDLFRDNVLFNDGELSGILDFYHACTDFLVQDLAIAMNDWCRDKNGMRNPDREAAMLRGYDSVRTLEPAEAEHLDPFRRAACARFTLTRLESAGDSDTPRKPPEEFLKLAAQLEPA